MSALPAPAEGMNPFAHYRQVLNATKPMPDDKTGLKIRLCVIFVILAYTFLASIANFAVHLYSNRLKERSIWLFRLVRRQGGTHIVSNHFVLSGLIGFCCIPVLAANAAYAWTAFLGEGDGKGIETMFVLQFSNLPVAYFFGWLLSWASFQSFLQVEGGRHRSRVGMPAWVENLAFVGGGALTVGCLVALTVLAALHNNEEWEAFRALGEYLDNAASSWDGNTLTTTASKEILGQFMDLSVAADRFYQSSERLAIAGAILPAIILFMNGGMWFFVHTIRKQVSFQLSKLTTVQVTAIKNGEVDEVFHSVVPVDAASQPTQAESPSPTEKHPYRSYQRSPSPPTSPPTSPLSLKALARDPFGKVQPPDLDNPALPQAIHFIETGRGRRRSDGREDHPRPPTRGKIRALSQNPDRLARDQAERLMSMMKAEQELLVLSCSIFSIAAALIIWSIWSIPKLKNHSKLNWADDEGLFLAPLWFYGIGLAFSETLHAWVEWRHLRPWRARSRGRSSSSSNSNSAGNTGLAILPIENGAATAVQVQVHVLTQVEMEEYEMNKVGRKERVVEPVPMPFPGVDGWRDGRLALDKLVEEWEGGKGRGTPPQGPVWKE